jgi:N-acetylglutamate synthase/N-acetylornithine aminotransferase
MSVSSRLALQQVARGVHYHDSFNAISSTVITSTNDTLLMLLANGVANNREVDGVEKAVTLF